LRHRLYGLRRQLRLFTGAPAAGPGPGVPHHPGGRYPGICHPGDAPALRGLYPAAGAVPKRGPEHGPGPGEADGMSWIQTRRRAQEAPAGRPMEDTLRRQMAWAAGTEQFQHRDPLYHVTESFQQTFDAIGRRHARQLAGGRTEEGAAERADQTSGENQMPDQTSARSFYE